MKENLKYEGLYEGLKVVAANDGTNRAEERGSTLVEMAFVLTVLLAVLFGIIDFGRALYTYHFVSHAAREGTRWASVRGKSCIGQPDGCPATPGQVKSFVSSLAATGMAIDPKKMTVTPNWIAAPNDSPTCSSSNNNPGCVVEVKVQYDYDLMFFPFLPTKTISMQSTSRMVISQ